MNSELLAARARSLVQSASNPLSSVMREVQDFISLSQGDPDLDTPQHIIRAAQAALEQGFTHYTPPKGLGELREAIALKLATENDVSVDPGQEVIVTTGAQEALFCSVQALLDKGDQLLVPDPFFTGYAAAACMAEAEIVPVPTYERDSFLLQPEMVESRITSRSKALLIINPTMPASGVYSRETLVGLAAVAQKHNLIVISDELYEKILFDSATHTSFASLPDMARRTITIGGFSKAYCMTGWRLGYAAGPKDSIDAVAAVKQAMTICTPAVSQMAALAALQGPQDFIRESLAIYDERRRFIMDRFQRLGISCGTWDAAHTVLANIQASGLDSVEFSKRLLRQAHVYSTPGSAFGKGGDGYIRVSLLVPQPKLGTALDGVERLWNSFA
jgi:aminotransferase